MKAHEKLLAALASLTLASCGGSGSAPPANNALARQIAQNASIVIHVPSTAASPSSRRPAYVSPSTQSIAISINPSGGCSGCSAATVVKANLTSSSSGCVINGGATTCTIALQLNPGSYTASVNTYDQPTQAGNVLSSNQSVAFTIAVNRANTIQMTLNGIPASWTVSVIGSNATLVYGAGGPGADEAGVYVDPGTSATFAVTPLDADGNAIVGAGAPSLGITGTTNTAGFTATANGIADTVTVTVPATRVRVADNLTFALSGAGCSGNPACDTVYAQFYQTPLVAVSDSGTTPQVKIYNERTQAFTTLTNPTFVLPQAVAFDSHGNLFVADSTGSTVFECTTPYNNATPIVTGVNQPTGQNSIAFDQSDDLFVSNFGNSTVTEYKPPYTSVFATYTTDISQPLGVYIDTAGDMFVLSSGNNSVLYYAAGFTSSATPTILSIAQPVAITQEVSGPLDVISAGNSDVVVFQSGALAGSSTPIDAGSNYVAALGSPGGDVTSSVPAGRLTLPGPPNSFLTGYTVPRGMATDVRGSLFVADSGAAKVWLLPGPPYSGTPIFIGGTWSFPTNVATWP